MSKDNKIVNLVQHRKKKDPQLKDFTAAQLLRLIAKDIRGTTYEKGKMIVILCAEMGEDTDILVHASEMSLIQAHGILKLAEQEI